MTKRIYYYIRCLIVMVLNLCFYYCILTFFSLKCVCWKKRESWVRWGKWCVKNGVGVEAIEHEKATTAPTRHKATFRLLYMCLESSTLCNFNEVCLSFMKKRSLMRFTCNGILSCFHDLVQPKKTVLTHTKSEQHIWTYIYWFDCKETSWFIIDWLAIKPLK